MSVLCSLYLIEYISIQIQWLKLHQSFDLMVIVQLLTLVFFCKNLDYKPQSINHMLQLGNSKWMYIKFAPNIVGLFGGNYFFSN